MSAVAVVNCVAHSRSGALSAETESFAVTRATIAEMYQSEVRPHTRTAVGARCSAAGSSSSAAGQPAAACRISAQASPRAAPSCRAGNYVHLLSPFQPAIRARRGDEVRANGDELTSTGGAARARLFQN